jgi:PRMT5 oligomerisation domain
VRRFLLGDTQANKLTFKATFRVTRAGSMTGLAGWFRLILMDEVSLTNDPASGPLHWKHLFFPLPDPFDVQEHQIVDCQVESMVTSKSLSFSWHVTIIDESGETLQEYRHSTLDPCWRE